MGTTISKEYIDNNLAVPKMLKERSVLPERPRCNENTTQMNSEEKNAVKKLKKENGK